jgi:glycosyltransferase involved in cell wall biosynthesis
MKIAMLGVKAVPAIGGVAHYCAELGSRLVERGNEVTVYCRPHYLEGDTESYYRGMLRRTSRGLRSKYFDTLTHTFTALSNALGKYDILHFHAIGPGILTPLAALSPRAKVVLTTHGFDWQSKKWGWVAQQCLKSAERVAISFSDTAIAVSETIQLRMQQVFKKKINFIPTGANFQELQAANEIHDFGLGQGDYLLFMGRLTPEKGVDHLLEAFQQVPTSKKLVIAGEANADRWYFEKLKQLADKRVIFTGMVSGRLKEELLSNACLFVQPSENEGLPLAVLEALSYGRCVVASDIPGNKEALQDCGYTYPTRDTAQLTQLLQHLLAHDDLIQGEFNKARTYIQQGRSWERTAELYEILYQSLFTKGGKK